MNDESTHAHSDTSGEHSHEDHSHHDHADHQHEAGHNHGHNDQKQSQANTEDFKQQTEASLHKLENYFVGVNKQLPVLPLGFRQFLVKIAPYLNIIGIVLGIIGIIVGGIFGIFALFASLLTGQLSGLTHLVGLVISIISIILSIFAAKGLFDFKLQAWRFIFWAQLVGIIGSIVSLSLLGVLVGIIALYFLFQVRDQYK